MSNDYENLLEHNEHDFDKVETKNALVVAAKSTRSAV
jgi:hypothetical protein